MESDYVLDRARAARSLHGAALRSAARAGLADRAGSAAVGYVVVTFVYGMEYGGLMAFVDDFFVRPAFRNSGLGTAALAAARDACAIHGRAMAPDVAVVSARWSTNDVPRALLVYRRHERFAINRPQSLDGAPRGWPAGYGTAAVGSRRRRIRRSHQRRLWYNVAI